MIPGSCDTRERGSLVHTVHRPFPGRVASKVVNCYLCCHVVTPIFMTIIIVQMTQISDMKVIGLMVDFLKIIKLWHFSIEFYGDWQELNP